MTDLRVVLPVALGAGLALAGCAREGGENGEESAVAVECLPTSGTLDASADAAALAGRYALTLVASGGARTVGTLTLEPLASDLQEVVVAGMVDTSSYMPLHGTAEIALDSVGAITPGDLMSTDPQRPGVVLVHRRATPVSMTLRFGSEANRRDGQRFDGGYTALRVQAIDDGSLAGIWTSGVQGPETQGHFCAVPAD